MRHCKAIMQELNLSPSKFAARLGLSRATVSNILTGKRNMGLDIFILIHRVYGVSANLLLDGEPQPPKTRPH